MLDFITLPESLNWAIFIGLILLSCFTSMLTASLGIGGGLLMLAAMAQVVPAKAIIPLHGVVQLGSNTGRTLIMLKDVRWNYFWPFLAGSIVGAIIGGNVVVSLPVDILKAVLGGFILFTVWGPKFVSKITNKTTLAVVGLASTFLTMFVGATGPFVIAVIRALELPRLSLVASSAAFLVLQHGLKVLVFGLLGFAFAPYLTLVILMIVSGFIGTLIGRRLLVKVDEDRFQKWLNIILSVLAIRLISAIIIA